MIKKIIFFAVLTVALTGSLNAQNKTPTFHALKVGDKVPDYILPNLINYPSKTAKIADFKGKLLVLDFWSTYCTSCIASWPKLLKLQEKFKDKLSIVLVNATQDEKLVRETLKKQKRIAGLDMTLPIVCKDERIGELFPHLGVPHIVWIDSNGVVASITEGFSLNESNLQKYFKDGKIDVLQKTDVRINVEWDKPLFVNGNGGNANHFIERAVFSPHMPGMMSSSTLLAENKLGYYVFISNSPIMNFLAFAFSDKRRPSGRIKEMLFNRIILKVSDTSRYLGSVNGEPDHKNWYTYQLITKPTTQDSLQSRFQEEVKRIFNLNASWVNMKRKCLVITAADTSLIAYKKGEWRFQASELSITLNKDNMSSLIDRLESQYQFYRYSDYPIVDETGFTGLMGNVNIEANIEDYKDLARALKKYKMDLRLEDRMMKTLVVTERK